jgi:hypothetical protein
LAGQAVQIAFCGAHSGGRARVCAVKAIVFEAHGHDQPLR